MRSLPALLLLFATIPAVAQLPGISIKDIYGQWSFYANGAPQCQPFATEEQPEGTYLLAASETTIAQYDYKTGKQIAVVCDLAQVKGECPLKLIDDFWPNATGEFLLLQGPKTSIYRRSAVADHYIYDIRHRTLTPLSEGGQEQQPRWSPNGAMIAYVKDNNLHIFKLRYMSRSEVTTDGERNKVINGLPDWVTEEEFNTNCSYEWSTDSRFLAFIRYNDEQVPTFSFPIYKASNPTHDEAALYPSEYTYKYPKAGAINSDLSLRIYDVENRTTKTVDLGKEECYLPRIVWTGEADQLAVVKVNRLQNHLQVLRVNAKSTVATPIYEETNKRYITDPEYSHLTFIDQGQRFMLLSENNGWQQLYLFDRNGNQLKQLTKGEYDVTALYHYNPTTQTVYYQAAKNSPTQREVYALNLKKMKETLLTTKPGTNEARFYGQTGYYALTHSSTTEPDSYELYDEKDKPLGQGGDNNDVLAELNRHFHSPKRFMTFPGADGQQLNAWVVFPRGMDQNKRFPVVMTQYSGPNAQEVLDKWDVDWEQTLADRGYLVVCVDPRGTGARGEEFRKCTYKQLGHLESDDLIAVAKHLGTLPYVDSKRIAIWGWSYGGFMSTLCLCRSDVFKAGVAVAPVTSWRFYDSVYTERFMQKPDQNGDGYDAYSPLSLAKNLKGRYFILSGTADDNVHNQNQMEMVDALTQAGIQFDMMTYPNRNHGLYGGYTRLHVYDTILRWLDNNL